MTIKIQHGWDRKYSHSIARLYDQAFGNKFANAIPCQAKRLEVLESCFLPEYSFVALKNDEPVGIAGFSEVSGSLTAGLDTSGLFEHLGILGGIRACLLFSLYERQPGKNEMVMDGIAVQESCRGQGVGSRLLDSIVSHAQARGYTSVRLDVIDSNARAKKLYTRKGFVVTKTEHFPYLQWLLGFSGSTTMLLNL
ncbi:molybdopterin-guanine dinucleotide biosynthesis protein MobC [Pseudoalteromonas rubra]|uniref:Molybdopterin-guanine dinucleotide biosynthesis protein MobC n=1 Tax=Pseudoalteromonas rubra TaxID=43658 RepID=A0A5S3WTL9_9GAMM|nr:GNAT family N-acetyltransferase [Pseudoalteromonas rubra]TMP30141.1 molybdopterin-guanine dinucleotide biosynthesis protein MobC [Pseudoalteromonas rubra]TMP31991.1 molybdopterin-guanine dinucleotide biosynthesis protein MobC [Pseudoalteromonas rubra]